MIQINIYLKFKKSILKVYFYDCKNENMTKHRKDLDFSLKINTKRSCSILLQNIYSIHPDRCVSKNDES
jgi:hypothetical protein